MLWNLLFPMSCQIGSTTTCKMFLFLFFLFFFTTKVASVSQNVMNRPVSPEDMYVPPAKSAVFEQTEAISLLSFTKLVFCMKVLSHFMICPQTWCGLAPRKNLDPSIIANLRHISHSPFLSKLLHTFLVFPVWFWLSKQHGVSFIQGV